MAYFDQASGTPKTVIDLRGTLRGMMAVPGLLLIQFGLLAQPGIVINNNAWVRIDNGAWVVLDNPLPGALQTTGTGGNLRSEGEFNRVRWQIRGATSGSYTVPFTSTTGVKIPFTYTVTAPGSNEASASIVFSTYNYTSPSVAVGPGLEWFNYDFRPSDVDHMNNFFDGSLANSDQAVDRFWIVDPGATGYAYSTLPTCSLNFTYHTVEDITYPGGAPAGNSIAAASVVKAQRYNSPADLWGDYLPQGDHNPGLISTVTNVPAGPGTFFRSWTLASEVEPLPVRLLDFTAKCDLTSVVLRWSTGAERNSAHFLVERSLDGVAFIPLGRLEAAGDSHVTQEYELVDKEPKSVAYYRLIQVDRDGTKAHLGVVVSGCDVTGNTEIVNAWDDGYNLNVVVRANSDQDHTMRLLDAGGKVMYAAPVALHNGLTTVQVPKDGMAQGVYLVRFDGPGVPMARRVTLLF